MALDERNALKRAIFSLSRFRHNKLGLGCIIASLALVSSDQLAATPITTEMADTKASTSIQNKLEVIQTAFKNKIPLTYIVSYNSEYDGYYLTIDRNSGKDKYKIMWVDDRPVAAIHPGGRLMIVADQEALSKATFPNNMQYLASGSPIFGEVTTANGPAVFVAPGQDTSQTNSGPAL